MGDRTTISRNCSILLCSMLLLMLSSGLLSCTRSEPQVSEEIYVYLRNHPGLTTDDIVQNLDILVSPTMSMNMSLPAFQDLQYAKWGIDINFVPNFTVNLDLQYKVSKVKNLADIAAKEFLRIFNYNSLGILNEPENNSNTYFEYQFGYLPISIQTMRSFLIFGLDGEGFSKLLENSIGLYIGNSATMAYAYYEYFANNEPNWNLWFVGISKINLRQMDFNKTPATWVVTGGFGEKTFSLNALMNNSGLIQSDDHQSSIVIEVYKNDVGSNGNYTLTVDSVTPEPQYQEENNDSRKYTWTLQPNSSMQDIVLEIDAELNAIIQDSTPYIWYIVTIVVMAMLAAIFIVTRKRYSKNRQR